MFKCINKDCEKCNQLVDVWLIDLPYITQKERIKRITCECGEKMVYHKEKEENHFPAIMKFASSDDKGKKEILKKRARKHYEKFEKKDVENKKLITQNDIRRQVGAKPLRKL